jgi:hypothetical protein
MSLFILIKNISLYIISIIMPTGYEFSQELKQLIFNVIKFVENEKNGPVIPLNNVNDRLESMLGISLSSIRRLKQEMREERDRIMEEKRAVDQAKQDKEHEQMEATRRLRHPRSSTTASTCSSTDDIGNVAIPVARPPRKLAHSGRPRIGLSEEEQENIR